MSSAAFTPKQVAQALGVSESSVKRWVDSGRLRAAKTVGGHRKVSLPSFAEFLRSTGRPLVDPDVLGLVATVERATLESAREELFELLIAGREESCRRLVLGFYQRGDSIADLGDRLIGPVFRRIGDGWQAGAVRVHEERRACEVMMATLYELRRWIAPPPPDGPVALVATPHQDFAEVPARLIELLLTAAGWRVTMAGSGLPLDEVRDAVVARQPRLVCLSAVHLAQPERFAAEFNDVLAGPLREMDPRPRMVVGGNALAGGLGGRLDCDLFAATLGDLARFVQHACSGHARRSD